MEKEEGNIQEANNKNNKIRIDNIGELIRLCLKSEFFVVLFFLMAGFVLYGAIMVRQVAYGKDSTAALLALYVWPILIGIFFLVVFKSMLYFTRKMKKSTFVVILFALMTVFIPICIITLFSLYCLFVS
ncbi:MAG: hypothetical protein WCQ96_04020 [Patescibacteria group bacterium]